MYCLKGEGIFIACSFSKEDVEPAGIHDEIKKRRFETLRQLQANEVWVMAAITYLSGAAKIRVRFIEKARLNESGNEVCVLRSLSRGKQLCGMGHKRSQDGMLLSGGLGCFASSH